MWYESREEAEEACKFKEVIHGARFYVLKDKEKEDCYWAVRIAPESPRKLTDAFK